MIKNSNYKYKFCFWGDIYSALIGKPNGGGQLQISLMAKELAKRGHKISIIDFDINRDILYENIKIISLAKRAQSSLSKYHSFYKILVLENADFYYGRIRSGLHLFGYLAAKKNNSKFILGLAHDLDSLGFQERYKNFYKLRKFSTFLKHLLHTEVVFKSLLKRSDLIISQHHRQKMNLLKKNIESKVCYNLYPFQIKKRINTNNNGKYYIFVGALDRRKGIDDIEKIIKKCSDKNFIIVGGCRDSYSRSKMEALKIKNNVTWLGQIEHKKIFKYLKQASSFISVSKMEGFPNTFIESWAQGVPVLSLNVNPGGVMNNSNLGKCYYGDKNELINDINNNHLKYDPHNIQSYVVQNHSREKNIDQFIQFMEEL